MTLKHSILVVTYNQAHIIGECLDSICSQSEKPYEVIVLDDCSTDDTWSVIQTYQNKFPDIMKAAKNSSNLGVFGNVNKIMRMATGDFVNFVSGDDLLPSGILAEYTRFIKKNKLNCNDPFVIYTNSELLLPDGTRILKNNNFLRDVSPLDLTFLCSLYVWDTGLSIGLVKAMPLIREDIGYQADWLQHIQRIIICEKYFFMDYIGYIYRKGVGVTVAEKETKQWESMLRVIAIYKNEYTQYLTVQTSKFLVFLESYFLYLLNPSIHKYCRVIVNRLKVRNLPETNKFKSNYKILIPVEVKRMLRKILRKN